MDEIQREEKRRQMLETFRQELEQWPETGQEPRAAGPDMGYYLDLQEKRIKKQRLSLELELEPTDTVNHFCALFLNEPAQTLYAQHVIRRAEWFREGKKLLHQENYLAMFATILDPEETDLGNRTCICPNCGSISDLRTLEDGGCPYCGTRYLMSELYPRLVNYYYFEEGLKHESQYKKETPVIFIWGLILAKLVSMLYCAFTLGSYDPIMCAGAMMFLVPALLPFALILSWWGTLLFDFFRISELAGKYIHLIKDTHGQRDRITGELSQVDPSFSYAYFEGKALSLFRILAFTEDTASWVQYEGPDLEGALSDIVDIQYRGGISLRKIRRDGEKVLVDLTLYLTNTLDDGKKLRRKDEKIRLSMYHRAEFPVEREFSLLQVRCRGCGGSFDGRRLRNCPFCGDAYHVDLDDWIITDIER